VAAQAGLPEIILQGTATHALGVTAAVNRHAGGDPSRVVRLTARFAGMVPMPHRLRIVSTQLSDKYVDLRVLSEDGRAAVRDAVAVLT
jgi:acyl dehydratase